MKKFIFYLTLLLIFCNAIYSNEIEIIELHQNKSLDQLVLDSENLINEEVLEDEIDIVSDDTSKLDKEEEVDLNNDSNEDVKEQSLVKLDPWIDFSSSSLSKHLANVNSIKSEILYNEFVLVLSSIKDVETSKNNIEIFFPIVKKLYEIGEIQKAYNLLQTYVQPTNEKNEQNIFYKTLELNYFLSTYQLDEACELKNVLSNEGVVLSNYLLEKTDIFCLLIKGHSAESELLNTLLLETERNPDHYFQNLYSFMRDADNSKHSDLKLTSNNSKNLIFLYSAMLRISELPLDEEFLKIDPLNLSIPVILSNATNMKTRIKAANKSYLNNIISIESLSALYQSVDFTSEELKKPKETIKTFNNNNELIMAFYYQLANIQIFPTDRLKVILDYWNFSEENGLEEIAYALTSNIIFSLNPDLENAKYGLRIAKAHIYNKNFEEARKWIIFYENSDNKKGDLIKIKFLFDLYQSNDLNTIINFLNTNIEEFDKNGSENIKEILYVLLETLDIKTEYEVSNEYSKIFDERLMPSVFLTSLINHNIYKRDNINLLLLVLVSLEDRDWNDIHPQHLKLIIESFKIYNNSSLLKGLIIEILRNAEIIK